MTRVSAEYTTGRRSRVATSVLLMAACAAVLAFGATCAEARVHHRRHYGHYPYRLLLVRPSGLIPGTYSAFYGQPGYGCTTSVLVGNYGGCGTGWAYEGGPGWGYR